MSEPEETTVAGCLEPIADEYERISRQWGNLSHAEPAPRHVEAILDMNHLADAVEWLVVNMAVDYGERLEKQIRQPIEMHQRAHWRALQILDDDLRGVSTEATGRRDAIRQAMEKLRGEMWIREDLGDADAESARIRRAYQDLEELEGGIPWAYRQAAEAIRRALPLLKDKLSPGTIVPGAQPGHVGPVVQVQGDVVKPDVIPDGPGRRGEFHYKGRTAAGIEKKPWLLLKLVWDNHPEPVDLAEVGEQVWDNDVIPEKAIRTAASKVNRALLEEEMPITVHVRNEQIVLDTHD